MNGNQFMGLRIRFDDGGCTNSARKSIRGLQTQWWRMQEQQSIHGAPNKMVEDA